MPSAQSAGAVHARQENAGPPEPPDDAALAAADDGRLLEEAWLVPASREAVPDQEEARADDGPASDVAPNCDEDEGGAVADDEAA